MSSLLLLLMTLLGGATSAPPADGAPAAAEEVQVPRRADAAAQLEYAREMKRQLRGAQGEARRAARRRAIRAYRAVRRYFPRERDLGAEAAFRAGELLRSGGSSHEAEAEFEAAFDLGVGTVFRARGGLELAHLQRRRGRLLDALASYSEVQRLRNADRAYTDRALFWTGKVQARLGRATEARASFEAVARAAESPLDRIDGFDEWALGLVLDGELEGAAGVLKLCHEELEQAAAEETRLGVRVRSALELMRAPERLAREVERRRARREDARSARREAQVPPRVHAPPFRPRVPRLGPRPQQPIP